MNTTYGRARKEVRLRAVKPVYFADSVDNAYWAMTFNISSNGVGLITNRRIEPGETRRLVSADLWRSPRNAKAIYCSTLDEPRGMFRVGMTLE